MHCQDKRKGKETEKERKVKGKTEVECWVSQLITIQRGKRDRGTDRETATDITIEILRADT